MDRSAQYFSSKNHNAHINGEIASTVKALKYLYKYVYKGGDSIREKCSIQTRMIKGSK